MCVIHGTIRAGPKNLFAPPHLLPYKVVIPKQGDRKGRDFGFEC